MTSYWVATVMFVPPIAVYEIFANEMKCQQLDLKIKMERKKNVRNST